MLKETFLGLEMVFLRMKRMRGSTFIAILTISLITSISLSLTLGTTLIQINMISNSLDSVLTDYNVRIIDEDSSDINIQALADIFSNNSDFSFYLVACFL